MSSLRNGEHGMGVQAAEGRGGAVSEGASYATAAAANASLCHGGGGGGGGSSSSSASGKKRAGEAATASGRSSPNPRPASTHHSPAGNKATPKAPKRPRPPSDKKGRRRLVPPRPPLLYPKLFPVPE